MGSIKVKNLLLSKKLKRSETRILIIDDNQIRFNEIENIFKAQTHSVKALLLDDIKNFEKQLNQHWDLIVFGRAYDIRIEQALALIQATAEVNTPVLLLEPDNYSKDQYQSYIHRGIYDVVNANDREAFYICAVRALSFSRVLQSQHFLLTDLENAKLQKQESVIEQNKAITVIQEGIHVQANAEYLTLFGLAHEDDIIGMPILDILQPKKVNDFKSRFKKISQGQFDFGRFEIETLNVNAQSSNPLKLEFLAAQEEDALQITIETESSNKIVSSTQTEPSQSQSVIQKLQRFVKNQPANANAIVLFSLSSCPDSILSSDWHTFKSYFEKLSDFIKEQTSSTVFKIEMSLYATVIQAESEEVLKSRLTGLLSLEKPQLVEIGDQTYQQSIRLGYSFFDSQHLDESNFFKLVETAYNTRLPQNTLSTNICLDELDTPSIADVTPVIANIAKPTTSPKLSLEPMSTQAESHSFVEPIAFNESPVLSQIQKALDKGEILLKYQQLYDKQDTNLNTYEVTSGVIFENKWTKLGNLAELDLDQALSIKVDRWIMVEACKQLHNFITQYPSAKLIINLNRHTLLNDQQLCSLVSKLITIVGSHEECPLILQFDEEDISKNIIEAKKSIEMLRDHGAQISIRGFGHGLSSESILKDIPLSCVKLDDQFTEMLGNESSLQTVQEKLELFKEIQDIEFILPNLNDMGTFANAWNVDARLLQGDYFQKKLDHLTDVQDQ